MAAATADASTLAEGASGTPLAKSAKPAADPLDATAKVAPLVYRSTLATYRRIGESESVPWREANDRVGRIGGWRAYAREANAPDPAASSPPSPPSPPSKPVRDDAHKMHGGMK